MISMQLDGLGNVTRVLHRIIPVIHNVESDAVRETCLAIRANARSCAPSLTGELRKSISFRTELKKGDAGELRRVGYIGIRASSPARVYWRFIEFGTSVYSAHPFFGPAAQQEKTGYIQSMSALGRRLETPLEMVHHT